MVGVVFSDYECLSCLDTVRDRVRTKMERDILVDVRHPFIVHLEYGELRQSGRKATMGSACPAV